MVLQPRLTMLIIHLKQISITMISGILIILASTLIILDWAVITGKFDLMEDCPFKYTV